MVNMQAPTGDAHQGEQTFRSVRTLLCAKFEVDATVVHWGADLVADLGIERADLSYLALALEEAFDINISTHEASQIVTVRDAVNCVLRRRTQPKQ